MRENRVKSKPPQVNFTLPPEEHGILAGRVRELRGDTSSLADVAREILRAFFDIWFQVELSKCQRLQEIKSSLLPTDPYEGITPEDARVHKKYYEEYLSDMAKKKKRA